MAQMSDQYLQLNEDGTPRRKHDIEEKTERRPVFFSFGGFAFFGTLAMIKNIWFGEDDLRAHDHGRSGPRFAEPPKDGRISDGDLVVASHPEPTTPADPQETQKGTHSDYIRGSGLNFSLSVLDLNFSDTGAISTARLGAPLAPPMNDNIRLYGATPGAPIILPSEVRGGGGGGGGGGTSEPGEDMQGGSTGGQGGGTPNAGGGTTGGGSVNPGGNSGSGGSTGQALGLEALLAIAVLLAATACLAMALPAPAARRVRPGQAVDHPVAPIPARQIAFRLSRTLSCFRHC